MQEDDRVRRGSDSNRKDEELRNEWFRTRQAMVKAWTDKSDLERKLNLVRDQVKNLARENADLQRENAVYRTELSRLERSLGWIMLQKVSRARSIVLKEGTTGARCWAHSRDSSGPCSHRGRPWPSVRHARGRRGTSTSSGDETIRSRSSQTPLPRHPLTGSGHYPGGICEAPHRRRPSRRAISKCCWLGTRHVGPGHHYCFLSWPSDSPGCRTSNVGSCCCGGESWRMTSRSGPDAGN